MNYACIAWGPTRFTQEKVPIFQNKALRIMNLSHFNTHASPLIKNCNVLKFADVINFRSCIFINKCFNKNSFSIFNENFKSVSTIHSFNTRLARNYLLFAPIYYSGRFERKSEMKHDFLCLAPKNLKILLVKFFVFMYNN